MNEGYAWGGKDNLFYYNISNGAVVGGIKVTKDGQRAVVYDVPSHQTQVLHYFDEDELESVERKEWSM